MHTHTLTHKHQLRSKLFFYILLQLTFHHELKRGMILSLSLFLSRASYFFLSRASYFFLSFFYLSFFFSIFLSFSFHELSIIFNLQHHCFSTRVPRSPEAPLTLFPEKRYNLYEWVCLGSTKLPLTFQKFRETKEGWKTQLYMNSTKPFYAIHSLTWGCFVLFKAPFEWVFFDWLYFLNGYL